MPPNSRAEDTVKALEIIPPGGASNGLQRKLTRNWAASMREDDFPDFVLV